MKLIYGYLMCQLCPFIIILIITIVCCVYAYFIYTFCFYLLSSNTHCIKIWHIWVILLRDVGANEREWYQHVEFKVERNWFECLKRFSKNRIIEVVMKEVNVCPTCRLPCVTRYSGVAVHVEYIEVWIFWRVWYSFPEDSALHVFSVVFVCGCNLTLCLREVFFFVVPLRALIRVPLVRTLSPIAIKLQWLWFVLKFCVWRLSHMYTAVYFLIAHVTGFGWGSV